MLTNQSNVTDVQLSFTASALNVNSTFYAVYAKLQPQKLTVVIGVENYCLQV